MATNKPNEANPVEPDKDAAPEVGPSRRELLVQGSKVAAGIGDHTASWLVTFLPAAEEGRGDGMVGMTSRVELKLPGHAVSMRALCR